MKCRRIIVKKIFFVGICLTILFIMSAIVNASDEQSYKPLVLPEAQGELRIGVPSLLTETFHPFWSSGIGKFYLTPFYDSLIGLNKEGIIDPTESIAYKWEEASDQLSWTFWIRDGVTFHNGEPLTLEDVKFSLDTMLDEKNVCVRSIFQGRLNRVEIVRPNKVVMHLNSKWPTLLYFLCPTSEGGGIILPKRYLDRVTTQNEYEENPIGSGPYKLHERKEGDYIKFIAASDKHWRIGTPKYKYITFKVLPEEGTREAALRSGEVDLIQIGLMRTDEIEKNGFVVHTKEHAKDMIVQMLRVYEPDNPLSDKKVRQALVYAIDKEAILKNILNGKGNVISHFYSMFSDSISYKDYPKTPYDPINAKKFLKDAGYAKGFTLYMYSFVQDIPEQKIITEAIAGYWTAIGMDVKILEVDHGAYVPIWTKRKPVLGPSVAVYSWSSRKMDVWKPLYNSNVEKYYFSQTKDDILDKLIEKYDAASNMDEFIKADRACEERVMEMYYNTGLLSTNLYFASTTEVPKWNLGREKAFRFEYIGAVK